jgi:DNA-binding NarL/FixJ family response regulator
MSLALANTSSAFAQYDALAAEYEDSERRCREILALLQAAEDELQYQGVKINRMIPPETNGEAGPPKPSANPAISDLSKRELEVLALMGRGSSTHEIAEQLSLATSTVETYRERLKSKLDIATGSQLTRFAILWTSCADMAARRARI